MMLLCSRTRIILTIRQLRFFNVSSSCQPSLFLFRHSRFLSTKNIFGQIDTIDSKNIVDIPSIPAIQPIKQSIQEIYNSKLSVINELELFSWWKPSGYFRYVLEYIHMNLDIPWWATIMCGNFFLFYFVNYKLFFSNMHLKISINLCSNYVAKICCKTKSIYSRT